MVSRGFTLTEMLIVVAIVGLIAAATTTSLSNSDGKKLDAATSEVVNLIRFARSEAIRTGTGHGVSASEATQRIRPYILGMFSIPSYTVRNPVDKNLYDLDFNTEPGVSDVVVLSVKFDFESVGQQALLGFNAEGVPKYESFGTVYFLDQAKIELKLGNDERKIMVAPVTGRVTVK